MMNSQLVRFSKFMSLVLRHQPERFGLTLDAHGWALIDQVIEVANRAGVMLTKEALQHVVAENDKQRFVISADGLSIRARQGHSIAVDVELQVTIPPTQLYHGTATRFLDSIRAQGLRRGNRQHVHLSADPQIARHVGARHGSPVVLTVRSEAMAQAGYLFYQSENGVWLTDAVPVEYLEFPKEA